MNNPEQLHADDHWIRNQRGPKNQIDPYRPYHLLLEKERSLTGEIEDVITIFLTNKECRFTCLMCDLWKNTTERPVPSGAIPQQIEWALEQLPPAKQIKLYNSANFFDPGAIPTSDYKRIAELVEPFETVIVENHPNLTGERCLQFARMLRPRLQMALGLETTHPEVLQKLNKKMKPEDFRRSVNFLKGHGISVRAFILLKPPFLSEDEGIQWAKESLIYAFDSGTDCCIVIPTRAGNGAMDQLQQDGYFSPPRLQSLEEVLDFGINLKAGQVFADTWDLKQFSNCEQCFEKRKSRIEQMNLQQQYLPPVSCSCDPGS
jgi:radical SAM enzyme (TIGR01210 family)